MTENRSEEINQETIIEYGAVDKNDMTLYTYKGF